MHTHTNQLHSRKGTWLKSAHTQTHTHTGSPVDRTQGSGWHTHLHTHIHKLVEQSPGQRVENSTHTHTHTHTGIQILVAQSPGHRAENSNTHTHTHMNTNQYQSRQGTVLITAHTLKPVSQFPDHRAEISTPLPPHTHKPVQFASVQG